MLIKNAQVFSLYSKIKSFNNYQSGYYNLQKSMDLDTIARQLQEGGTDTPQPPVVGKVTIPEGYTLEQIAEAVTVNAGPRRPRRHRERLITTGSWPRVLIKLQILKLLLKQIQEMIEYLKDLHLKMQEMLIKIMLL